MKRLLAVCMFCVLLAGCCLNPECPTPTDENVFLLEITFHTDRPIHSVSYRYSLDGTTVGSGGACNADNSPIAEGEVFLFPLDRNDLPENTDHSALELELFLTNAQGKTFPCQLSSPVHVVFGQVCKLQLEGNFINGFTA